MNVGPEPVNVFRQDLAKFSNKFCRFSDETFLNSYRYTQSHPSLQKLQAGASSKHKECIFRSRSRKMSSFLRFKGKILSNGFKAVPTLNFWSSEAILSVTRSGFPLLVQSVRYSASKKPLMEVNLRYLQSTVRALVPSIPNLLASPTGYAPYFYGSILLRH